MVDIFKNIPLFSSMKDEHLQAILDVSSVRTFPRDHLILLEDDDGDTMFVILRGKVKVTVYSEHGKEVIFSILCAGDFFGDMSLLDGKPRSASVVALEESEMRCIRRSDFLKLLQEHPKISLKLLEALTARLRKADERIESLSLLDVSGRLAGILLQLADESGTLTESTAVINDRPTHQELANMAGTTRETVTRILKQLEKKQYLTISRKDIVIHDPQRFKRDLYL